MNECLIIDNATVYDGTGRPGQEIPLAVVDSRVVEYRDELRGPKTRVIDGRGLWLTPGFLDIHTHYDVELEVLPGLEESVRHGVTTVVIGNCSLSLATGGEDTALEIFCRVENLPRSLMQSWLRGRVTWSTPTEYYEHVSQLSLGPNVASFIGHSNVRAQVMGFERSLNQRKPTREDLSGMVRLIEQAMDAGFLGLSIDMLPLHRVDGQPFTGQPIPSQRARPREYRKLAEVVRRRGRVLQAVPNAVDPRSVLRILGMSTGLLRKPLKTTVVAALDIKSDPRVHRLATFLASACNHLLRARVRWQALAEPFANYADGPITPLFEEFDSAAHALGLTSDERRALFAEPAFRARFRREFEGKTHAVFHRDLADMWIVSAPEPGFVGQSFSAIAAERGIEPIEFFMDCVAEHDTGVRWMSQVANHRKGPRQRLLAHPTTLPGFNDSGAHNRNMAFQDGALQLLRQVHEDRFMSIERAVQRLTQEPARFLGIDAGTLRPGDRADLVLIDPQALTSGLGAPVDLEDERLGGVMRMVKRSDGVVKLVAIGGRIAFDESGFAGDYGQTPYGRLLRAGA